MMPGMVLGRVKRRRLLGRWSSRSICAHERNQIHISGTTVIAAIGTRNLIEIDVGFLSVRTIRSVTGILVKSSAKLQEISHNHGIHHDDKYERYD